MSLSKIATKKLISNFYWKADITNAQTKPHLTFSCRWSLSYKNQSIDLQRKLVDWFYMIGTSVMNKLKISFTYPSPCYNVFCLGGFTFFSNKYLQEKTWYDNDNRNITKTTKIIFK